MADVLELTQYELRFLPVHLETLERWDLLQALFLNLDYLQAVCGGVDVRRSADGAVRNEGIYALLNNLDHASRGKGGGCSWMYFCKMSRLGSRSSSKTDRTSRR